ncbi:hypothetical protein DS745_19015 [Anaerobacillus alkaliphilus]|uniref:G5 domain-containing protein n=1 Tax=Anaerobacillus alkaliphilus TaxID=1548597 RepID=A0A4Q0VR52_9BACI|nr:VanW family protein [Anaerobacillus alkaliphilus]RXI98417.1 hypothetical protein DS745_19015 [Anaerobacillus alkaliphilus]
MTSNQLIKTTTVSFITLFISTALLIGFTYGGSFAYSTVFPPSTLLDKNTRVANISIGEMTIEEATKVLREETEGWKATNAVSFLYKDNLSVNVAAPLFFFDIDGSIQYAKTNNIAPLFVSINEGTVDEMLHQLSSVNLVEKIDLDLLYNDLQAYARSLKQEDLQVNIHDYILATYQDQKVVVSEAYIANFTNSETLKQLATAVSGTILEPRQTTSFFTMVADTAKNQSYEMNVVATALYTALLSTNFEIVERHIDQTLPDYSELGFEAFVSYPSNDLRFYNPNYIPYTVEINLHPDFMHLVIVGYPLETKVRVERENEQSFDPKTVLQFSALVAEGEREIVNPGQSGFAVNVLRKTFSSNNSLLFSELISEDFYRPAHRIEIRSLIKKEEPLSSDYQYDFGITNPGSDIENETGEIAEEPEGKEVDEQSSETDSSEETKGY